MRDIPQNLASIEAIVYALARDIHLTNLSIRPDGCVWIQSSAGIDFDVLACAIGPVLIRPQPIDEIVLNG